MGKVTASLGARTQLAEACALAGAHSMIVHIRHFSVPQCVQEDEVKALQVRNAEAERMFKASAML